MPENAQINATSPNGAGCAKCCGTGENEFNVSIERSIDQYILQMIKEQERVLQGFFIVLIGI
jgi:hypothetical protein